jgi:hypothetical protein
MTTIYTGEEGKRIKMAMHQHFLESRRKSIVSVAVRFILSVKEEAA